LRNTKLFERYLERREQTIGMRARPKRDAHTSLTTVIARTVANQNAAPPHVLDKRCRRTHTREHEVSLAGPELNSAGFERSLQPCS
jgi:hypothetical protein